MLIHGRIIYRSLQIRYFFRGQFRCGRHRLLHRSRIKIIRSRDDLHHLRSIRHIRGEWTYLVKTAGIGNQPMTAHPSVRRLEPNGSCEACRLANRTARIRTQCYVTQARSHRRGRTARRSTRYLRRIQRILHRPKGAIFIARTHGELITVRTSDKHGVLCQQSVHDRCRKLAFKTVQNLGGSAHLMSSVTNIVLQRNHHTGQLASSSGCNFCIHRFGMLARFFGPHFQENIQILGGLNLAKELFNRLGCRTHRSLGLGKMLLFVIV